MAYKKNKHGVHTVTIGGQTLNLSRESWSGVLERSDERIGNGLRKYGTMQKYIDNDLKDFVRIKTLRNLFLFGGDYKTVQNGCFLG